MIAATWSTTVFGKQLCLGNVVRIKCKNELAYIGEIVEFEEDMRNGQSIVVVKRVFNGSVRLHEGDMENVEIIKA